MATIHAVYASTSGNVEWVIDTIADYWRQAGHTVITHRSEQTPITIINDNDLFVFGCSTWEHGEINPFFARLFNEMQTLDFSNKAAFFVGCGDFRYEPILFNTGIQIILEHWKKNGGTELHHPLKLNNDPQLSLNNLINPWCEATTKVLAVRSSV